MYRNEFPQAGNHAPVFLETMMPAKKQQKS